MKNVQQNENFLLTPSPPPIARERAHVWFINIVQIIYSFNELHFSYHFLNIFFLFPFKIIYHCKDFGTITDISTCVYVWVYYIYAFCFAVDFFLLILFEKVSRRLERISPRKKMMERNQLREQIVQIAYLLNAITIVLSRKKYTLAVRRRGNRGKRCKYHSL